MLFDHYELLEPLGAGGMGEVWRASDTRLDRTVAVKLLHVEFGRDPDRLQRFQREARAASALSHPNVCTIYALGEAPDGRPYLAMEYVEGETLRQRLTRARFEIGPALDIAAAIASAIGAAHGQGIVHRDIKPENVIIRSDGLVKVLDFGLAKLVAPSDGSRGGDASATTRAGEVLGTVRYMSPEQARGEAVDQRSDLWSLGVVLFENEPSLLC